MGAKGAFEIAGICQFDVDATDTKIDYSQINLEHYAKKSAYFPVLYSKYCPYRCTYCNARKTGLMERDMGIVSDELQYLKKRSVSRVGLRGNNLIINRERFIEICRF